MAPPCRLAVFHSKPIEKHNIIRMEIDIDDFIEGFSRTFFNLNQKWPWLITGDISEIIQEYIVGLDSTYSIDHGIAIHRSATIESNVIIKTPAIVGEGCFIGANAYLRGGVFLGKRTVVGTSCEVKSSIILNESAIAHFNFIGDSIIGNRVNFEAGSIIANHYNEKENKSIRVLIDSRIIDTNVNKFGALVGDNSRIGANAVLSPGTILKKRTVVKRLELIEQYISG
jgi:NDP-sugar pyrophosphorylase family protein